MKSREGFCGAYKSAIKNELCLEIINGNVLHTPSPQILFQPPNPLLITPTHTTRSKCIVPQYPPRQKLTEFGEFSHLMILFSCTDQEGKIFSRSFDCAAIFTLLRLYHRLSFWLDARKTCIFSLITSLVKWGLVSQYPQKTFLEHFWTILSSVWTLDIPEDLEVLIRAGS